MSKLNAGWRGWLAAAAVAALLAACGASPRPTVTGVAQVGGPVVGEVTVIDSSATPVRRTAGTGVDGAYAVDASGLTPPFMIRVTGTGPTGPVRLFSATEEGRRGDVNPITSAAFSGASGGDDDDAFEGRRGDRRSTVRGVVRLLERLEEVLAPLLERYGIADPSAERAAVRQLLEDVRFEVRRGVLTVTNRATGAVIFTGPLDDLASGTFDPAAMPPGPGPGPGTGEGALLYDVNCASCHGPLATSDVRGESAGDIREAIEEDEGGMGALSGLTLTQLQAIAAALSGSGGGGTPPPSDGALLYDVNCSSCHGPLATSDVRGESAGDVREAIEEDEGGMGALSGLTLTQLQAIAAALSGSGGGGGTPGACTFTYGAWGACMNGSQTRTLISATPPGCTGTPVLTQACTVDPPPPDGAALYTTYCAGCHGNSKKGSSAASIQAAINGNVGGMGSAALRALTPEQVAAIAAAP